VTTIQNNDLIVGGGASTSADVVIVAGGATLAPGAEDLTIVGGEAGPGLIQITLDAGSFALNGSSAALVLNRLISPVAGLLQLAGEALEVLRFDRTLSAERATLAGLSGAPLRFRLSRGLRPQVGQYSLSGSNASLISQKNLVLEGGLFELIGQDIELSKSSRITLESESFILVGEDLGFLVDASIRLDSGSFSLSGEPLQTNRVVGLTATPGIYTLSGSDVEFAQQERIARLASGLISLTGSTLLFSLTRQAVLGRRRPTSRRFTPGGYSFSAAQTVNGREVRRLWGNMPNDASLELEYENISESIAVEMLNLYDKSYGDYSSVALPAEVLAGADGVLQQEMTLTGVGLKWYFAEPPRIVSVFPGICSMSLRFKGKSSEERAV
jgi:hypothetical protein